MWKLLVVLAACAPAPRFVTVRDDTTPPPEAAAHTTVIALSNGHYLTLAPSGGPVRWRERPDLSYLPAGVAPAGSYVHVDLFYLRPGMVAEAEALTKEHVRIDREAGVSHAWEIFSVDDGPDAPLLVQLVRADSRDAYERERAAAEALRGPRIRALYARDAEVVRRESSLDGQILDLADYATEALLLPGATGLVTLDYFAFDRATGRLWVPAGNTGSVDVIEGSAIRRLDGFSTAPFELHGKHGLLGASSVSIGDGAVYIGNRADRRVCRLDAVTTERRVCVAIAPPDAGWGAAPDGVVYVPTTHELWLTRGAPPIGIPSSDLALTILDGDTLEVRGSVPLGGSAEGYAVDAARGILYTNVEETRETLAIDVRARTIRARWRSGCDEPHGLALDRGRGLVFVACSARVIVLRDGAVVGTVETGNGVDNIDYDEDLHLLYAAAEDSATLTIARVELDGRAHHVATVATVRGTRGAVAGPAGAVYVADPYGGRILKITPTMGARRYDAPP